MPQLKVLIIICYFVGTSLAALVAQTITFLRPLQTDAVTEYIICQSAGLQPNTTCDRTPINEHVPFAAMTDAALALFFLIPAVNLIYAINRKDVEVLKKKCIKITGLRATSTHTANTGLQLQ